nr:reverse transcriptase-like protein [Fodinicola feengrottensis]
MTAVVVEADGGSRGNPGVAGYGALVRDARTGDLLAERAEGVGFATNNVAEYSGLVAGLTAARDLGARRVAVRMDSKLVVEQMSGRWKIKHPDMVPLAAKAKEVARAFDKVTYEWIPRAQNSAADALANSAMDGIPVHRDLTGEAPMATSGQVATTLLLVTVDAAADVPHDLAKYLAGRGAAEAVLTAGQPTVANAAQVLADALRAPVETEPDLLEAGRTDALLARFKARGGTFVVLADRERVADILRVGWEAPPRMIERLSLDVWGVTEVEFNGSPGSVCVRTVNDTSAARAV